MPMICWLCYCTTPVWLSRPVRAGGVSATAYDKKTYVDGHLYVDGLHTVSFYQAHLAALAG